VARDVAFAFAYEHMLLGWRRRGAELSFFSPLAGEGPDPDCDAVLLPAAIRNCMRAEIARASRFKAGISAAIDRDAIVYGECGGFMVLGEGLIDAEGVAP
jgi:cobyrinic acid a,c-diamide synthase